MSKCRECSELQLTCCVKPEIFVTNGDIERIVDYTGRNGFYHLRPVPEELKFYYGGPDNVEKGSEIYFKYLFDEEGRRNILKKNEKGECFFLSQDGCILPPSIRPIICRLYPYDWNDNREIWLAPQHCPKTLFKDEQEMKEQVCLPEEEAKRAVDLLYDELMNKQENTVCMKEDEFQLQRIPPLSWVDTRLDVRSSPIHGKGLFANASIQPGEVVIIWGGVLFTLEDIRAGKAVEHGYAALRQGLFLGHTREQGNSPDDFMNHSCDPNIWMTDEITWVARRAINKGDEVTGDCAMYWGPDGDEEAEWECHCGSALCRKVFTSQDWQLTELHGRYGNHFSPYINERIKQLRK